MLVKRKTVWDMIINWKFYKTLTIKTASPSLKEQISSSKLVRYKNIKEEKIICLLDVPVELWYYYYINIRLLLMAIMSIEISSLTALITACRFFPAMAYNNKCHVKSRCIIQILCQLKVTSFNRVMSAIPRCASKERMFRAKKMCSSI